MRPDGSCKISHAALTFTFPKASSYGQGVNIATTIVYDKHGKQNIVQRDVGMRDMRLMVLIGVNDDERNQKQPVVVDFDLFLGQDIGDNVSVLYNELFAIEQKLAKVRFRLISTTCHILTRPRSSKILSLKRWRRLRTIQLAG